MKKYFLLSAITFLFLVPSFSQSVSINNDGSLPNPSAMLDVNSPSKGLLISRVTLTGTDDVTTISTPAVSLLVYNTATTSGDNAVSPGYYYWGGSAWLLLSTGSSVLKKDNMDSIANTGYASVYRLNKARDSVQANLDVNTTNVFLKKDNTDSVANTGYASVYRLNKARDSVQANIDLNTANILLKKDNTDSVANTGYASVYRLNKAKDSVQTNIDVNTTNILLKKDNTDSVANTGYGSVYRLNKSRDSVQANIDVNTANILLKKDNIDSVANTGYASIYRLNKVKDSVQSNLNLNTANILLKKDNTDSTNSITGYTTLYQNSLKEAALAFSTGLTRTGNTITNNLSVGVSGGQTIIGSTSNNSGITYLATSGASAGVTGADHVFKVGNNGSVEAMRIVSDSLGYVGIGTSSPTTVLHIKKNLPAPGHNTVLKIENAYGAGNFGLNNFGGYWQNSSVTPGNTGGFNIYNLGGSGNFGINGNGNVGIGTTNAVALLEIKASNGTRAPFKFNSGPLISSPLAGAIEFNTDSYYATITNGGSPARKTFAFLEGPTFTGTVNGISKSMVGLGNVDNTSDVNKPVSTATQTALNLKWSTIGDAGTNTSTNFIGTTDNIPFNIRVNNQKAGSVDNTLLNTFWGYLSANANTTGNNNTAIGASALITNTLGNSNTALGSGADVSADGLSNATAIGAGTIVDASNKVRIGNASVTVIEGQVAYTIPSDARFKYNIRNNVPGLDFITRLTPVTYYFDEEKLKEYTKTGLLTNNMTIPVSYKGEKQLHTGFLAQDVARVSKELGYSFDGVHAPSNDKDHYSIAYSQFIMPLVKSVQEQQQIIENQDKKIESQAEQIKRMNERIEALAKSVELLTKK